MDLSVEGLDLCVEARAGAGQLTDSWQARTLTLYLTHEDLHDSTQLDLVVAYGKW